MIKILFFAQVRELTGTSQMTMPANYPTVESLRAALSERGDKWALALESGRLLTAVNQAITDLSHPLSAGDEVAFFPPVTGG
ncbi:MAG: molybdopterin synthase sulfur carrier subunit [Enterobacteriaceae bacterium]